MKPYSQDLRERVIAAMEAGEETAAVIAEQFQISKSTADKWWARYRHTGCGTALPHGGGQTRVLAPHDDFLRAAITQQPDVSLAELQARLETKTGVTVSSSMMSRTVTLLKVPRKKKTRHPTQRDTPRVQNARQAFTAKVDDELSPVTDHLKFLDECGVHLGLTRDYGRAAPGVRVPEATSEYGATRYTVLAAIGLEGVTAALVFEGGLTKHLFEQYVELILAPTLSPGDIVLMDNLSAHKSQRVEDLIVACGARLEFLPPYSPDFNPMELCWAKVKPQLRTAKARTEATLVTALGEAFQTVTLDDLEGWFDHCGYIEV